MTECFKSALAFLFFFRFFIFSMEDSIQIDLLMSNYCSVGRIQYKSTLCLYILRNFDFGLQNRRRTNTRYAILDRRYFSILLIFNSKQCHDVSYIVCKFEENRSPNTDVRVPQRLYTKWPPWRHQIKIFKIWEKWHWQTSKRVFVWIFIQICWVLRAVELIHTHRQTDRHTHIQTPSARF